MAADDRDSQTEAPTAKRLRDAAAKGDVLTSRDLSTALVMLAGAGWLALCGPAFVAALRTMLVAGLTFDHDALAGFDPAQRVAGLAGASLAPIAWLLAVAVVAAVAGTALLGSLGFRTKAFAFDASKLDPLAGLARVFGTQGLIELGKSLAKIVAIGGIAVWLLHGQRWAMLGLATLDISRAAPAVGTLFVTVVLGLGGALAMIGLIDAPLQWQRRTARLRMTPQAVKQELRESEGSPETKHLARQRRGEILSGSARRAVADATVVLTNPTHFAVALRYRPGIDAVPMVMARGRGETAQAIKALAADAAVPRLEYPQLTRALYFTTRAGQPIASDLYLAVATVLAFVLNLDRALAEGAVLPDVSVPAAKRFDEAGRHAA